MRQNPAREVSFHYGSMGVTDVLSAKQHQRTPRQWREIDPSLEAPEVTGGASGSWKKRAVESGSVVNVVGGSPCDQTYVVSDAHEAVIVSRIAEPRHHQDIARALGSEG